MAFYEQDGNLNAASLHKVGRGCDYAFWIVQTRAERLMAILIKTAPNQPISPLTVRANGELGLAGEAAFVWFSETQGGAGLVARATIRDIEQIQTGVILISLNNIREVTASFGNRQIGPFRDSCGDRPESTLAKKIYRYAHNRIVPLSDDEAAFLQDRFA